LTFVAGEARWLDGRVLVEKGEYLDSLAQRGYGMTEEGGRLALSPEESLYLVAEGKMTVKDKDDREPAFRELAEAFLRKDAEVWTRYLVFRDLRSRGYVVKEGYGLGLDFRVYDRGTYGKEPAKLIVVGVSEGKPLRIDALVENLKMTQSSKKELVLAVIDRRGEVVYYAVSPLGF